MPKQLRCWKPKDKSPLPAPGFHYNECEAAIAWGYKLREWQEETVENRAKAIAHCLHKNLREGYISETTMAKGDKKREGDPKSDYEQYMRLMH